MAETENCSASRLGCDAVWKTSMSSLFSRESILNTDQLLSSCRFCHLVYLTVNNVLVMYWQNNKLVLFF